jgi:Flp pilus assembly protein protease CpaA
MSVAALATHPADLRLQLAHLYRRLLEVPPVHRVAAGVLGPLVATGVCLLAKLPPVAGLLVWLLGVSAVSDLLWRRIFNWITGPALMAVAVVQLVGLIAPDVPARAALPPWQTSLAGFGLCLGLMLFLWLAFRGGEGDVKLIAVLGAILGPYSGVEAAVGGSLLAAAVALGILGYRFIRRLVTGRHPTRQLAAGTLPMAPFFASAVVLFRPTLGGV